MNRLLLDLYIKQKQEDCSSQAIFESWDVNAPIIIKIYFNNHGRSPKANLAG